MRIVHCFRSPVGGIFRHVRDLCEAQAAAGHEVGIVCDSTTGGAFEDRLFAEIAAKLPLGVARTPMQRHIGPGDIGAAARTLSIIRRMHPDVLHGHGAKGGVYARLFGTALRTGRRRVARIYSPHGGSLHYDPGSAAGRFFFGLETLMGRFTDHIFFVSLYEQHAYERKVGKPRAPASLVYNGLRAAEFTPVADAPDAADFLYIGMMRDLKGPDLFIDALKEAEKRSGRALSAVMVGDGNDLSKYIAQAQALGFGGRIVFHPAMPARKAFALGRMMVVPSRAEAMPYIVLEALAAGKPLIATAVGGIPEILGETSPALVRPSVASLAEKMTSALEDEAAYRGLMPPESKLRARFGLDVMAARIEAVYRQTLGS
ncbi:glycosyltransferase family 4 protein [Chelativorans sp. AA-79]|uniref:glycosyltransferase family 4 protein n=1 Tax=Chelativorans sp. AA-79 TaxID=3028735 RepID=UPI0023F9890A|nr:glycosyltransferase family 4 protein [Chelativorans sp. AA-79]WEX11593.1 glycosyltransferase family 4 protein [Chelativorans sp. AA-79]